MKFKEYIKEQTSVISEADAEQKKQWIKDLEVEIADHKKEIEKLEQRYKNGQKVQDQASDPEDPKWDRGQDTMDAAEEKIEEEEEKIEQKQEEIKDYQAELKADAKEEKSDDKESDGESDGESGDLDKEAEKYAEDTDKFISKMRSKYKDDDKTLKFLDGLADFVKKEGFLTNGQRKALSNLNQK